MRSVALAACLLLSLGTALGSADDIEVPLPDGWTVVPGAFAARGNRVAVALQRAEDDFDARIMQVEFRAVEFTHTLLPGRIWSVAYSDDGSRLLVHGARRETGEAGWLHVWLLSSEGDLLWSAPTQDIFHFTGDGSAIWAVSWCDQTYHGEVRDLSGRLVGRWTMPGGPRSVAFAYPNGPAERMVVAADERRLERDREGRAITIWSARVAGGGRPLGPSVRTLRPGFVIHDLDHGFDVVASDGSVVYAYRPEELTAALPSFSAGSLQAFRGRRPRELLLVNPAPGYTAGGVVDLDAPEFRPERFDFREASGFHLASLLEDGLVLFQSRDAIRIRVP